MRIRIWTETALAGLSAFLCLLTLVWKDWLEGVFGWDPDAHSGSAEWLIALVLLALALGLGFLARRDRRAAAQADGT